MLRPHLITLSALLAISASAAEPKTLTIHTLAAQMRFDTSELTATPGESLKLIFENLDDLPHNIVFFAPGTDVVAVSAKQLDAPEAALKRDWLPDDPRIWLHSKMVGPKAKEELVFKAPDKVGEYPFVCTFPGHALNMQGKLKVIVLGPTLSALKFQLYLGDWQKIPDFSTLKSHREGLVESNRIEIKLDDYKNQFGIVYTGKLNAPKDGDYTFFLASDDGARILIDGKKAVDSDGTHNSENIHDGKIKLTAGDHEFKLEYFQGTGEAEIYAGWSGPGFATTALSTWHHPKWQGGGGVQKKDGPAGIPLKVGSEPIIYRNFIAGTSSRTIAVGYPGNLNLAWSAQDFNLSLVWRGGFIDAARHWIDRGGGAQSPLGYDIFQPTGQTGQPFAIRTSTTAPWPETKTNERAEGYKWTGYHLDPKRYPTFSYTWNGVKITDGFDAISTPVTGEGKIIRTLKLTGALPANATFRAATGTSIQAVAGGYLVEANKPKGSKFPNIFKVSVEGAMIVGTDLVLPARPEIKLTYTWPEIKVQPVAQ